LAWLNIYQNIKQIIQDAIAPEIQSIKGDIKALEAQVTGLGNRMDSLETELKGEIAGLRGELRSFEARVEKRFEEQSRQWELAMDVRERLAALEAQTRRR